MNKTAKILVSALLTLCMLLPMAMPVFASGNAELPAITATKDKWKEYYQDRFDANATQYDVYTVNGLLALAEVINADPMGTKANGYLAFTGKTVSLKNDLVFNEGDNSDWASAAPDNSWLMIKNFAGTFDGEGHTISGLYFKNTSAYTGFIGQLRAGARIKNLGIVNSYFDSTYATNYSGATGSIAARVMAGNTKIEGCYSDAIINSKVLAGGIVGCASGTSASIDDMSNAFEVSNCAFYGSVTVNNTYADPDKNFGGMGGASAAGILAQTLGFNASQTATSSYNNIKITDCVNFGKITNTSTFADGTYPTRNAAAGVFGYAEDGRVEITRCLNFGDTTGSTEGDAYFENKNALFGLVIDEAVTDTVTNNKVMNRGVKFIVTDCYIFTDLQQNLFNSTVQNTWNNPNYSLNGVSNDPAAEIGAAGHIGTIMTNNASAWTKTAAEVKGERFFDNRYDSNGDETIDENDDYVWTARTAGVNYAVVDQYPLPTAVYNNFFKVELKYVQSTNVDNGVYDVRIIAEVDSLNYNAAGFEVIDITDSENQRKLDVNTKTAKEVKVYKTVKSISESYTAVGGRYYVTITITGISGECKLQITPYTYGDVSVGQTTKVTGVAKTLTFGADGVCTEVQ